MDGSSQQSMPWLVFALMTVASWGLYGIFLHKGQIQMGDAVNGRYKAFLWVGIAYMLVAVIAPALVLVVNKSTWSMPGGGIWWSLIAGVVGAVGAFCVLLAFGAKGGTPPVVMSIIFAGAPIVNAVVAITMDKNWGSVRWEFMAGILMAALGGFLVTKFKPSHKPHPPAPAAQVQPLDVNSQS